MRRLAFLAALVVGLVISSLVISTGPASATTIDDRGRSSSAVLSPKTFTVELLPSGDPDGSGVAVLTVNLMRGTVCYNITVSGIGEPTEPAPGIGSAHIHSYAQNGAIAVDLETNFQPVAGTADTYQASGCVTASRRTLVDILLHPELYYVNVHTMAFPAGAVQGDLA
jgi:CHRD domain